MDEDVADAILMANFCDRIQCLPGPGGLRQQDSKDIWLMQVVWAAQAEKREFDRKREEALRGTKR
jgi:hypothetical protein